MSPVTPGGIVASIVPFDPTVGITVVATVMLSVFVLATVFFAIAPLVSSSWTEQPGAASSGGSSLEADANEAD
ncbi:hypothetical protein [Natronococcus wangiae]|uniref:hypothetical protein n=1 Tax=Natronococcus wangiae TaxID=3068275 RepID=UPI00273DC1CC|nr:hypothetical protein [Natronococcus sp. AD5]